MREGVFSGLVFYACLLPALVGLASPTAAAFLDGAGEVLSPALPVQQGACCSFF
jgi:hypothetical protein